MKISLKWGKERATQVQETQRVPYRINTRRNMPRHPLIKLTKLKHKEKTLKAAREKQQVTYKGIPTRITAIFPQKLCRPEENGRIYLKVLKGKKPTNKITVASKNLVHT